MSASIVPWALAADAGSLPAGERESFARAAAGCAASSGRSILLDTCHRTELYGFGARPDLDGRGVRLHAGAGAVARLIRIAAGLESAVIGEDEVLHQVRQALKQAREGTALDYRLARLFEAAIATGRKARAGRASNGDGLAERAVEWLDGLSNLRGRDLLVVGAGRIGSALARAGAGRGALVTVASRSRGDVDLVEAARLAPRSAAVAVALAGPWEALRAGPLPPTADLSSPSAIVPHVRGTLNGRYLGIDDLFERPSHLDPRARAFAERARTLVDEATETYCRWLGGRPA